ncbi:threonine-type endopeptidase [Aureococcus anophagefferens]|nr:threonine-type endopeptidase [Aureococcus anophagefferens]
MRAPAAVLRRVRCALLLATAAGAATNSPYSFSLSTFSPDGRLQQIEFAFKAVERALPAAAVICADGVVLAKCVRKGDEGLGRAESPHVCRVTEAVVATYAGLPADFRALEHRARGLRPGCSVLLAGVDDDGVPKLYRVDPSGWCAPWTAAASASAGGSVAKDRQRLADGAPGVDAAAAFLVDLLDGADRAVATAIARPPEAWEIASAPSGRREAAAEEGGDGGRGGRDGAVAAICVGFGWGCVGAPRASRSREASVAIPGT